MNKALIFAKRNAKEILRDPLSWIFCLGFPVAMLVMFRVISASSPGETDLFGLDSLAPGIAVFSFSFVMLYMAILTSKDKSTFFLIRLFSAPMTTFDFLLGYAIPGLVIAFAQVILCFAASAAIAVFSGQAFSIAGYLCGTIVLFPLSVLFIAMGIFFGTVFSEKAAPGMSSLIISLSGMLSGAWMPLETMKAFGTVCRFLPFYPTVRMGREAVSLWSGVYNSFLLDTATVLGYIVFACFIATLAFKSKMKKDK